MKTLIHFSPLLLITTIVVMCVASIAVAASHIEQGDIEFAGRNITKAIQQYQIELKNNPDSIVARTRLAKCYIRKGYKTVTSKLVDEALSLNPYDVDALLLKSKIYRSKGQIDDATQELNKVIIQNPDNIEANYGLADIYSNAGNNEAADQIYLKIKTLRENK